MSARLFWQVAARRGSPPLTVEQFGCLCRTCWPPGSRGSRAQSQQSQMDEDPTLTPGLAFPPQAPLGTPQEPQRGPGQGRGGWTETPSEGAAGERGSPTQRGDEGEVLQHHVLVQVPLRLLQQLPLLAREGHEHVLEGHAGLAGRRRLRAGVVGPRRRLGFPTAAARAPGSLPGLPAPRSPAPSPPERPSPAPRSSRRLPAGPRARAAASSCVAAATPRPSSGRRGGSGGTSGPARPQPRQVRAASGERTSRRALRDVYPRPRKAFWETTSRRSGSRWAGTREARRGGLWEV